MKKLLFFSAVGLLFLVTSCKKDKKASELIVGKWNVTELFSGGANIIVDTEDYSETVEIEFTSSGTLILTLAYTDKTVAPPEEFKQPIPGTYSISGDNLTISVDDGSGGYSVTGPFDVTSTNLTFTATSGDTDDFIESMKAEKL